MSFARPTLKELRARIPADYAARVTGSTLLPVGVLPGLAETQAVNFHELYGAIAALERQQFPQTALRDGLLRWADLREVTRRAATFAAGPVRFTGTAGSAIPAGTTLARADGVEYRTSADATIPGGGAVEVDVAAQTAGVIGNAAEDTALRLSSAIAGVASSASVETGGLVGGVDAETDEELRVRVLEIWRTPPAGGTAADWLRWAKLAPGVTRAWVYANLAFDGVVQIAIAVDDADYGPIPTQGDLDAAAAFLEQFRPMCARLILFAPTAKPLNMTVHLVPDTAEVRAAVENNVRDLLRREAVPGGRLLVSHLREAISLATGETDSVLYSPTSDVVAAAEQLSVFGTTTFV